MADNYLTHPKHWTFAGEILALTTFAKYDPDGKGLDGHFDISHHHDVGYGPQHPAPDYEEYQRLEGASGDFPLGAWPEASREDVLTLRALGWSWDPSAECWAQF